MTMATARDQKAAGGGSGNKAAQSPAPPDKAARRTAPTPPPVIELSAMLRIGALGSMMLGLVHTAGWSYAAAVGTGTVVLTIFGVIGGALLLTLGALTRRKSRVGWSFLVALNGVGAVVSMFGAPAIHRSFGIPLATAFVPFAAHGVMAVLLALSAAELERRGPPTLTRG